MISSEQSLNHPAGRATYEQELHVIENELNDLIATPEHQELLELARTPELIKVLQEYAIKFGEKRPVLEQLKGLFRTPLPQVEVRSDVPQFYSSASRDVVPVLARSRAASDLEHFPFGEVHVKAPKIKVIITQKKSADGSGVRLLFAVDNGWGEVHHDKLAGSSYEYDTLDELIGAIYRAIDSKNEMR